MLDMTHKSPRREATSAQNAYRRNAEKIREAIMASTPTYPSSNSNVLFLFAQLKKPLHGSPSHSQASLSQVSLNIYLMRTDRSTYVCFFFS